MRNALDLWRANDAAFDRWLGDWLEPLRDAGKPGFSPACDIEELEGKYVVSLDIPGVSRDDVRIELKDSQLLISGERKEEHGSGQKAKHFAERFYGRFQRVFALPETVDAEKVEAEFSEGVLRVSIPKAEKAKPRLIQIQERPQPAKSA